MHVCMNVCMYGYKFTTECLAGVVVSVNRDDLRIQLYQTFNGGYLIGRGTCGCHYTHISAGVCFELRTVPVYSERTDSSIFSSFE